MEPSPILGGFFMPTRLLCVGKDLDLLRTRCAVLCQSGYDALSATVAEAELLLRTDEFDLIIVSAFLDEWEKGRVLAAAGKMRTLMLRGLTLAPELLAEVAAYSSK
jgi:hypothetical protein